MHTNNKPKTPVNPRTAMHAEIARLDNTLLTIAAKTTETPDHLTAHARWRACIVQNTARFSFAMASIKRRGRGR